SPRGGPRALARGRAPRAPPPLPRVVRARPRAAAKGRPGPPRAAARALRHAGGAREPAHSSEGSSARCCASKSLSHSAAFFLDTLSGFASASEPPDVGEPVRGPAFLPALPAL